MTMADSTVLPPLPNLRDYVQFVYWKYSCFPKDSPWTESPCQLVEYYSALYVELFCICFSLLPDPANANHSVHAAFLPAEEGVQVMLNFAFGYATLQGHQSNTKEVYIQTGWPQATFSFTCTFNKQPWVNCWRGSVHKGMNRKKETAKKTSLDWSETLGNRPFSKPDNMRWESSEHWVMTYTYFCTWTCPDPSSCIKTLLGFQHLSSRHQTSEVTLTEARLKFNILV